MLAASADRVATLLRSPQAAEHLTLIRRATLETLRTELLTAPILSDSTAVVDYLFASMAHRSVEEVRVLFLDAHNRFLGDERVALGDIDHTPFPARMIVKRALELDACGVVIAHNHPSGDPAPSADDVSATQRLVDAATPLGIDVLDHIVIARSGWTSLRGMGLLQASRTSP